MKPKNNKAAANANSILKIFNFIGGALIFFGIAYFISSNWHNLSDFLKIFSTLGAAIAAFSIALLLATDERYSAASSAFFMIAGLTLPFGMGITFDIAGLGSNDEMIKVVIAGICLLLFMATNFFLHRDILRLFCAFFGSLFFIAFTNLLFIQMMPLELIHLYDYQMLALGVCYFVVGYYLHLLRNALTGPLYFFGSLFIFIASFDLGGLLFFSTGSAFWKILAPFLVLLSFLAAVPLRSKALLYNGALFLVIYLASMTSLFAKIFGSFGWPLLLIMAGLFLMVLGYLIVKIQQKINRQP